MASYHPRREDIERFARGDVFAHERSKIEDHLRSGCGPCQRLIDEMLPCLEDEGSWLLEDLGLTESSSWEEDSVELDRAFARMEQRLAVISLERSAAPRLVAELNQQAPAERIESVRKRRRFQTLAICDLLLETSFEEGFRNPGKSVELAELAIEVAGRLDAQYYGKSVVEDLRARAWAYLGNARRVSSDLVGAEQAIAIAEYLSENGSGDPLEEARILDLKASLLSDQGRFEEAAETLDLVIDIYHEVKEFHRKGRAILSKGLFIGYSGQPEQAIQLLSEGLSLVEWDREPRLVLMARHNYAWFLNDCGRCEEALSHLQRFRHSYHELFPEPWTELRLAWLEGRIAAGLERFDESEAILREARKRSVEQGLGFEASMITLDLAALYLQQGKGDQVKQLASTLAPALLSQDLHGQAIAALAVFQQFAEMDRVTLSLVQEITAYLFRAQKNPKLSFRM
jgi:tetratricopeptide (TPR) repeat protein